jgi:hypothetical protein
VRACQETHAYPYVKRLVTAPAPAGPLETRSPERRTPPPPPAASTVNRQPASGQEARRQRDKSATRASKTIASNNINEEYQLNKQCEKMFALSATTFGKSSGGSGKKAGNYRQKPPPLTLIFNYFIKIAVSKKKSFFPLPSALRARVTAKKNVPPGTKVKIYWDMIWSNQRVEGRRR